MVYGAYQAKVEAAEAASPSGERGDGKRTRHKGRQAFSVLTVNGRVRQTIARVRWHCPQEGTETLIDQVVDQAESSTSQGVREMACRVNQDASSFQKAAANLWRTAHLG